MTKDALMVTAALLVMANGAELRGSSAPPRFGEYRVGEVYRGNAATPILHGSFQEKFRTAIKREGKLPANFAGHYRIAEWGCGTSCVSFVVIDLQSGSVEDGPFRLLSYAVRRKYEGGDDELEYRVSSRLLIARGCPEDRNCGTYYYLWTGEHFDRLRYVPAGPVVK